MKKLVFILFISLLFTPFAFAEELEQGACCYVPNSQEGIVEYLNFNTCPNPDYIYLGKPDNSDPTDFCKVYRDTRLGCEAANGACSAFAAGNAIYNLPEVLNSFAFNDYCANLVPYTASCQGNQVTTVTGGVETGGSTGGSDTGSNVGSAQDFNGSFVDTGTTETLIRLCADAGGPFGFFVSQNSCEAYEINGEQACVFNPYLGGKLSSDLGTSNSFAVDPFESACIPKSEIRSCFDYKTQNNCELNPSSQFSEELSDGCRWVETTDYSGTYFDGQSGMCIASSIDPLSYYDAEEYSFRQNLIQNPSFEEGVSSWDGAIGTSLIAAFQGLAAYDGVTAYLLNSPIEQTVLHVDSDVAYTTALYVKPFTTNGSVQVTLTSFDNSSATLEEVTYGIDIASQFSEDDVGIFKRVTFPSLVPNEGTYGITLSFSATENMEIDAILFEPTVRSSVTISENIFKPVEIVSADASHCELCYDEFNLNLCTQEKSDYLGACSYMVESPEFSYSSSLVNYLGMSENLYANTEPWQSQSLPNAALFCEMYLNEEACVDPNNFVNTKFSSHHQSVSSTLCTWDENIGGCFKDSNVDGLPDTRKGTPSLRALPDFTAGTFDYQFEDNSAAGIFSDYALACDTLPPNSYVYFTATNSTGDVIVIDADYVSEGLVGNLNIHVDASDAALESCAPFTFNRKLFVDYDVNTKQGFRVSESNQLRESYDVKDYFIFDGVSLFENGINNISLFIKDQSGNVGKEWAFAIDVDGEAPLVELISHTPEENGFLGVFGQDTNFTFRITDYSEIDYCNYRLVANTKSIPGSFYNASGSFDLSSMVDDEYVFDLPIYNTSENGDYYILYVDCADIFNQVSENGYVFAVDYNANIVLIEPPVYRTYEENIGFLNRSTELVAISADKDLTSCSLAFDGQGFTGTTSLNVIETVEGFSVPDFFGVTFYYNITGDISFSSDGFKQGTLSCIDGFGNTHEQSLEYYYDTLAPEILGINLTGPDSFGLRTVIEVDGEYYTRTNEFLQLNVSVDGTGSWLNDSLDMVSEWEDGISDYEVSPVFQTIISNISFIGNSIITSFEFPKIVDLGIPTDEEDLYEIKYHMTFTDKAGNNNFAPISYFSDDSSPTINFTGDIQSQDESRIFTNVFEPNMRLTFNAPSYRLFNCTVIGSKGPDSFIRTFESSSEIFFTPADISSFLQLTESVSLNFDLTCTDEYGVVLQDSYDLFYDNTEPILNDMFLSDGDLKFYRNYENAIYEDFRDDLVFDLENTSEVEYSCKYRVISPSAYYSCNSTYNTAKFTSYGLQKVTDLLLLSRNPSEDTICVRTDEFYTEQQRTIQLDQPFETSLVLEGYCTDRVGYTTETQYFVTDINYIRGDLGEFEFFYNNGFAFPRVRSISSYESIRISLNEDGSSPLLILSNPTQQEAFFEYTTTEGINLQEIGEGTYEAFAVVLDEGGEVIEYLTATLLVDKQAPTITLFAPDETNGEVFSESFEILYTAQDNLGGSLDRVEFYLQNELLLSSEDLESYNDFYLDTPDSSTNAYNADRTIYNGRLIFTGQENTQYEFRVIAYDEGGNSNETTLNITIRDGLGIVLEDSTNALVDPTRFSWVTKSAAPTINFRTSKFADLCTIYPLGDFGDSDTFVESASSSQFSFDLSTVPGFNLPSLSDTSADIEILCLYNNTRYNFTRTVAFVDQIPDYTLISSEGFILNEVPYTTTVEVKSVGPYRYINCEYSIDSGARVSFDGYNSTIFRQQIDFSSYSSGLYTLNLQCKDIVGNEGYEKTYEFEIIKNDPLQINNVYLESNEFTYNIATDNSFYIGESGAYDLVIELNKKQGTTCSYIVNTNTLFSGPINFFRDLFSLGGTEILVTDEPYEFRASGLLFDLENPNSLRVDCGSGGSDTDSVIYNVEYNTSSELGLSVTTQALS